MPDLMTRLAALREAPLDAVDDRAVTADLRRARTAFVTRRHRRQAVGALAAAAVVAAGVVTYSTGDDRGPARHVAASSSAGHSSVPATTVELVAYRGAQLPGYTVERIPAGYVLQGISGSVLDVAKAGDHSPLDTFVGKLVVMLDDHPGPTDGTPVTVDGRRGNLATSDDGVQALTYTDGEYHVAVQAWSDIEITPAQLVQFAEGVTVLPTAQVGHG